MKDKEKEPELRKPITLYWDREEHEDIENMSESPMNARDIPMRHHHRSKLPKDND